MQSAFWDARYANEPGYVFGTEPNDFLVSVAANLRSGARILCVAEGEGRNAAFLAAAGHQVTAVDHSAIGLEKGRQLATARGVVDRFTPVVADLLSFDLGRESWDAVVWIFLHLSPGERQALLKRAADALKPGGLLILECYTPRQVKWNSGGPVQAPELLLTWDELRSADLGLHTVIGREVERDVIEGTGHTGRADVVQWLARKL